MDPGNRMDPRPWIGTGRQCGARSKQTGERCERAATPGHRVCYFHGSRSKRGPRKSGRYARFLPDGTRKVVEFAASDPSLLEPRDVAALMQGLTFQAFERAKTEQREPDIASVMSLQDRRLAAIAAHDRRQRWKTEVVTKAEIQLFLRGVVAAVNHRVSDGTERQQLADDMRRLGRQVGVEDGE